MKLALVGPGIMPIPPNGWGAVEMMIWDYHNILTKHGIEVNIINTQSRQEIVEQINSENYDIVHIHYDVFIDIITKINSKIKIISSHYPYINDISHHAKDNYHVILPQIANNKNFHIFASSQKDIDTFIKFGATKENIFLSKLGVKEDDYVFYTKCIYDKTLCFSQIVGRKRQYLIQNIDGIDFMGRLDDQRFSNFKNYKGEVSRNFLNQEISKYSNFILISSIENTTPLVVKEALICGLGVVVSEAVAYELNSDLDFVSLIKEKYINDIDYIKKTINENKLTSNQKRNEIRKYGIENFGLESILTKSYIKKVQSLL
jgi:flavodoxin